MMISHLKQESKRTIQEAKNIISGNGLLKKRVFNLTSIYALATAMVLIPGCIDPKSYIGSLAFVVGMAFICFATKDLACLSFYFISLLINSSLAELPIIGTSVTLTSVIYAYFIFMLMFCLTKLTKIRKMEVPLAFLVLWISYLVFLGLYFKQGIFHTLWNCVPIYICVVVQILVLMKPKYRIHLISSLMASVIIMCFTGYVEFILGRTFFYSLWKGKAYRFGIIRIGSTVADPNFVCLIELAILFILRTKVINYLYDHTLVKIIRILIVLQIIMTFSRTGILALVAGYVIEVLCSKKKWMLSFIPIIVVGLLVLSSLVDAVLNLDANSTTSRLRVIEAALSMWRNSPIIGNGNGAFYQDSYSLIGTQLLTMNVYVEQLVSYGIIGLSFYVIYCYLVLKKSIRLVISSNPFQKFFAPQFISAVSTWIIMSASLDTFSKVVFWVFPSVVMVLVHVMDQEIISSNL